MDFDEEIAYGPKIEKVIPKSDLTQGTERIKNSKVGSESKIKIASSSDQILKCIDKSNPRGIHILKRNEKEQDESDKVNGANALLNGILNGKAVIAKSTESDKESINTSSESEPKHGEEETSVKWSDIVELDDQCTTQEKSGDSGKENGATIEDACLLTSASNNDSSLSTNKASTTRPKSIKSSKKKLGLKESRKVKNMKANTLQEGRYTVLHVLYSIVFVQDDSRKGVFNKLTCDLKGYVKDGLEKGLLKPPTKPLTKKIYVFIREQLPYRVTFHKVLNENKSVWEVYFMDIGNIERVQTGQLLELPESSPFDLEHWPPSVEKCYLNFVNLNDIDSLLKTEINKWIKTQLFEKTFYMEFGRPRENVSFYVNIYEQGDGLFNDRLRREIKKMLNDRVQMQKYFSPQQPDPSLISKYSRGFGEDAAIFQSALAKSGFSAQQSSRSSGFLPNRSYGGTEKQPSGGFLPQPSYSSSRQLFGRVQNQMYSSKMPLGMMVNQAYSGPSLHSLCSIPNPAYSTDLYGDGAKHLYGSRLPCYGCSEKEKEMAVLQGKIDAYDQHLLNLKGDSMKTKLATIYEEAREAMVIRNKFEALIGDDTAIQRAANLLLLDNLFHYNVDNLLQIGRSISKNFMNWKVEINRLEMERFNDELPPLKLHHRLLTIKVLIQELEDDLTKHFPEQYGNSQKAHQEDYSDSYSIYAKLSSDFLAWRETLTKERRTSEEQPRNFVLSLQQYVNALNCLLDGKDAPMPDLPDLQKSSFFSDAQKNEMDLSKNSMIAKTMICILEELKIREKKIMTVLDFEERIKKLASDYLPAVEEEPGEEAAIAFLPTSEAEVKKLPTLLKFMSQSKEVPPTFKIIVIEDIFDELRKLHSSGLVYLYLNPANIVVRDGARLFPISEASIYEPMQPYKFLAPECQPLPPDMLMLLKSKNYLEVQQKGCVSVGPEADFYSLGQLIRYMYCAHLGEEEFMQKMLSIKKSNPLLKQMLDPRPINRPSVTQMQKERFSSLVRKIFTNQGEASGSPSSLVRKISTNQGEAPGSPSSLVRKIFTNQDEAPGSPGKDQPDKDSPTPKSGKISTSPKNGKISTSPKSGKISTSPKAGSESTSTIQPFVSKGRGSVHPPSDSESGSQVDALEDSRGEDLSHELQTAEDCRSDTRSGVRESPKEQEMKLHDEELIRRELYDDSD